MDVGSETNVIGKIPANVVRIIVDYDFIAVPIPVTAIADVVGRHAEEESTKPKAFRASSTQMPNMSAADLTRKVSVLPRMIEMVVSIVTARIVTDPLVIRVHVRCLGMARLVFECGPVLSRLTTAICVARSWCGMRHRRRAMRGNMAAANFIAVCWRRFVAALGFVATALRAFVAVLLGKNDNGADQ